MKKTFSTFLVVFFTDVVNETPHTQPTIPDYRRLELLLRIFCIENGATFLNAWKEGNGKVSAVFSFGQKKMLTKQLRIILTNFVLPYDSKPSSEDAKDENIWFQVKIRPLNYRRRVQYQTSHNEPWLLWQSLSPLLHVSIKYMYIFIYKYTYFIF